MIGNEGTTPESCEDCETALDLQVLHSSAGYYIGTQCACGPYSRESDYFAASEDAYAELADWLALEDMPRAAARTPGYHPDPNFTVMELPVTIRADGSVHIPGFTQ